MENGLGRVTTNQMAQMITLIMQVNKLDKSSQSKSTSILVTIFSPNLHPYRITHPSEVIRSPKSILHATQLCTENCLCQRVLPVKGFRG